MQPSSHQHRRPHSERGASHLAAVPCRRRLAVALSPVAKPAPGTAPRAALRMCVVPHPHHQRTRADARAAQRLAP
eukprot:14034094-Alexandrium_andersonii.AAC.1